jgi:hypothetical protein
VALTQAHVLALQDLLHAHRLDNVSLTQADTLSVADLLHQHLMDGAVLSLLGILIGKVFMVNREEFTFIGDREERVFTVPKKDSTFRSVQ